MNRSAFLDAVRAEPNLDLIVIGGGATGLGAAADAAARGYRVALLEQHDFAKGTSSRSTKLVHGGVRYLKQGNVPLVMEALRERGRLARNAPHLVRSLEFVIPIYHWWDGPFFGLGMKVYDALAGSLGLSPSRSLSLEETVAAIPTVEQEGLIGGVSYFDAQFDDARLAIDLARTCADLGGLPLNYVAVTGLLKENGIVRGVRARDAESGDEFELRARVVINATGVFGDAVRRMDEAAADPMITFSQGVHLVLPKRFLPGSSAIMVPKTGDGRVLFAVPWHDRVIVGTTDTPVDRAEIEPRALTDEIAFLMQHAARYLHADPTPADVLSVFAGLRPLVRAGDGRDTATLSRDHTILVSHSGLVTVTGGKWTTYRQMAEDVIDQAERVAGFEPRPCVTHDLAIHGSDTADIARRVRESPELAEPIHPRLPYLRAEIVHAVREEMARTVEDVLSRRTRALLLDARASIEAAPRVAAWMAADLGRPAKWAEAQAEEYRALGTGYLL
jgi:glycerol-3-phosphate dehydrogenase